MPVAAAPARPAPMPRRQPGPGRPATTRVPLPKGPAAVVTVPTFSLPSRPSPEGVQGLLQHLRALQEVGVSHRVVQAELKRMAYQVGGWGDVVQASILREEERAKPNRQLLATLRTLASSLVQVLHNLQARTVTSTALAAAVEALIQAYPADSTSAPVPPIPAAPPAPPQRQDAAKGAPAGEITGTAAIEAAHSRMSGWKTPNSANAGKLLDDLEMRLGLDVAEARDALTNYQDVTHEEYPDADEYRDAREEAWGELLDAVEAIEPKEQPEEGPPATPVRLPKALQKLQGVQDARLKTKAPKAPPPS